MTASLKALRSMTENSYWDEIERYFTQKRGRALILSPKDWPLITSWQERGIPLDIIYAGIDRVFARHEAKETTNRRQLPRTLSACQAEIEKLWDSCQEKSTGAMDIAEKTPRQQHLEAQRRLATKLRSTLRQLEKYARTPHYAPFQNDLRAAVENLDALSPLLEQAADADALIQVQAEIRNIEHGLNAQLEQHLPAEVRRELMDRVAAQLASYQKQMRPEVYAETFRLAFLKALHEVYPLPSFW
jgi:hypothetical protein